MGAEYDVIVVGAGFGGPVAAKKCAEAGLSTLMVERAEIPGEKVISGLVIPIYGFLFGPAFIREGNPPIERPITGVVNRLIKDGRIFDTDRTLTVPRPLALGYAAYCKPFCTWLADRAVESGAELRTSTTAREVILENGRVSGIVTDGGEELRCRVLIDAGGTQNQLSIKAGLRRKFSPEAVELYMIWDFEMDKADVDRVFGTTMEFFHAMPEENIGAPLGYGSTLYFFTYRDSIHPGLGQFLVTRGETPNAARLLRQYFDNFTGKVERWTRDIAPSVTLRSVLWDVCPIYAGLLERDRAMPIYGDGMLIAGDAAGFEAAAFGDGVPNAWFSADLAADVAIEAVRRGDSSRATLSAYEGKVRDDPFILHTISDFRRWDMRRLLLDRDMAAFKRKVRDHWGIGAFRYRNMGGPCLKAAGRMLKDDPGIMADWLKMFARYWRNWETGTFDPLSKCGVRHLDVNSHQGA